jgi:hypothetical protein
MRRLLPVASLFFGAVLMADAAAQVSPPAKDPALAAPPPAAKRPVVPAPEALLIMVRSTLIALHHGNVTGNYTVLRDLAAPGFQAANSAASLGQIFGNLRAQRIDLAPALLLTPELVQGPAIGVSGNATFADQFPDHVSGGRRYVAAIRYSDQPGTRCNGGGTGFERDKRKISVAGQGETLKRAMPPVMPAAGFLNPRPACP